MADPREYGPIDFAFNGDDDGYNTTTSIEPVENGEPANEDTFQRPTENVRDRTEIVRTTLEQMEAVISSDRGLIITSDPATEITWNGTVLGGGGGDGKFTITGDLNIVPLTNPSATNAKSNIYNRLSYDDGTNDYFTVRSKLRVGDEGGNNLKLEIWKDGTSPGSPVITVEGSVDDSAAINPLFGPVLIRIQIAFDDSHDWTDVLAALGAYGGPEPIGTWIGGSVEGGIASNAAKVVSEQFLWEGTGVNVSAVRGVDAQTYRITSATLVSFFGSKVLAERDVLVINFGSRTERLARAGDTTIQAAELEIINENENNPPTAADEFSEGGDANFMNVIPLCKVIDNDLFFLNGAVFDKGAAGKIMPDSTLRTELADQTASVCGSEIVGSDVRTGSPRSLAQGTAYSQLGVMIQHYNDHVNANQDKHPIKDITDHPIYVVGTNGDYTNLATAITTVASTTGGIILVKPGVYNVNIDITDLAYNTTVIGEGGLWNNYVDGVVIKPSVAANPALAITDDPIQANLTFENVCFYADNASNGLIIEVDITTNSFPKFVKFKECQFIKKASGTADFVKSTTNMIFERCFMTADLYTNDEAFIEVYAPSGYPAICSLEIRDCYFTKYAKLVTIDDAAEEDYGRFEFTGNFMANVGYSSGVGSAGLLIRTAGTARARVNICNNFWYENTGAPAGSDGLFCDILGSGDISNNKLEHGLRGTGMNGGFYIITATGYGDANVLNVSNNTINSEMAGCIEVAAANARGNFCYSEYTATQTGTYMIRAGSYSLVSENRLAWHGSLATPTMISFQNPSTSVRIADNYINLGSDADAIAVGDAGANLAVEVVITSNTMYGGDYYGGVVVTLTNCQRFIISNNTMQQARNGIRVEDGDVIVSNNNLIYLDGTNANVAINYGASMSRGAIVGNFMYGRNSGDTGIVCAADDVAIAGNSIMNFATTMNVTGDSGIGTTGSRTTGIIATHNCY